MKYVMHLGVIRDILAYGVLHFNFETIKEHFQKTVGYFEDAYVHYEKIKPEMPAVPPSLYAFFYSNGYKGSFIADFMFTEFDFFKDTFDDFLSMIKDYDDLCYRLLAHYFDERDSEDWESVTPLDAVQQVLTLDVGSELKIALVNILLNFEEQRDLLHDYLEKAYPIVESYHQQLYNQSLKMVDRFPTKRFTGEFKSYCEMDKNTHLEDQQISVSYLNSFLFLYRYNNQHQYTFIVGKYAETVLEKIVQYEYETPQDLFTALVHPVKREILESLYEQEYTATQLSEKIYVTRQSVNHHLLWLNESLLIRVSKRKGPEIYYTINADYFKAIRPIVNSFLLRFEQRDKNN